MVRRVVYVTHQGARIHRSAAQIAVSVDRQELDRWAADELDRVVLMGNVQLTTQAIALLLRHGVSVVLLSSQGRYRGQIVGPESGNVFLRLAQHARYTQQDFRLALAKGLVTDKIRGARDHAQRYRRNHPDTASVLDGVLMRLDGAVPRCAEAADLDSLRGIEGAAAAAWFEGFATMVKPPFAFTRRSRHPADDEVNALLNLGYTLLASEIAGRLEAAGFDPRVGYYHGVRYGTSSLALDVIEPFRVRVVDRLTLSVINRRMLAPDDFLLLGARGVRLQTRALKRWLSLFEEAMAAQGPADRGPRDAIDARIARLRTEVMDGRAAAG